jgi:outer membrane protein, heavy metal efflux system
VLGTGRAQGFSGVEATLALSQVIELGGQRQRRQAVAGMQRSAVEIERERVQLDVLAELGRRFIHVATDQEQLALNRMATRLVVDTLAEVQRRVDAGRSPMAELHRARIAVARAEIEQEHAEHELLSSRRALAALWGEREARFAAVSAQLFELPRVADLDTLIARLEQSPDLLRYANTQRLRDAEAQLAKAKGQGSPTVTGGIRRLQDSSDTALVAGLSLPLFGRAQAQPAIAEATAQRDASAAAQHASRIDTEVRLFALLQELTHAITETTVLRDRVLPEMDQALVATRKAWQHGRYSYLELTEAQSERVVLQRALIDAAAKAHTYHIEIERLTGTGLQPAAVAAPGAQP